MQVEELIDILLKLPKNNIVLADLGQEESADITDVLFGSGTNKGFVYLQIEPFIE